MSSQDGPVTVKGRNCETDWEFFSAKQSIDKVCNIH